MLAGRRVLIAEDEPLIAMALAHAVEAAHGEVAGPVSSVEEGLALIAKRSVHAAILDVRLIDRDVAPVARLLLAQGRAVVFHTASPVPEEIFARHGNVVICEKPMASEAVVRRLARLIAAGG
jgi:DNA-binding NarL/FixJ family response regulator